MIGIPMGASTEKMIVLLLSETPAESLAALKAQWQAEAAINNENFNRENRYIVIKRSDAEKYLRIDILHRLFDIETSISNCRMSDGKSPLECVVVEHDWPEYESVWSMLAKRVSAERAQEAG